MLNNNLKNIVVLKNLPSNLIDEAIVILKSKKTARKLELIEKNSAINYKQRVENNNDYILKEAEMVVNNYIAKMEKNNDFKNPVNNMEKKYRKIKVYSVVVSIILFLLILQTII